ncbi:SRPBCC family protein [Prauserella flavalba]|uniref:SRPBCC family protein n=1 Tax=Prauserella flavalba TaxID=1477506 RepID=UPI0036ECCCC3
MIPLNQQFRVDLGVDDAWVLLTDLPKVARCMPGANLDQVIDDEYRGRLSTKIGPINATYQGVAVFRERDDVAHRAVVEARGREAKGSGSASALVTLHLKPDGEGTLVDVSTELAISGRAAQFGRSLLAEVSNAMLDQFVQRLEAMIAQSDDGADTTGTPETAAPSISGVAPAAAADARGELGGTDTNVTGNQSLDVVRAIVLPLLRRAAVPIVTAGLGGLIGLLAGRRGRRASPGGIPVTYVLPYPGSAPHLP